MKIYYHVCVCMCVYMCVQVCVCVCVCVCVQRMQNQIELPISSVDSPLSVVTSFAAGIQCGGFGLQSPAQVQVEVPDPFR